MARTLLIAGLAVREALRRKIALAGVLLGTAFLVIFGAVFTSSTRNCGKIRP